MGEETGNPLLDRINQQERKSAGNKKSKPKNSAQSKYIAQIKQALENKGLDAKNDELSDDQLAQKQQIFENEQTRVNALEDSPRKEMQSNVLNTVLSNITKELDNRGKSKEVDLDDIPEESKSTKKSRPKPIPKSRKPATKATQEEPKLDDKELNLLKLNQLEAEFKQEVQNELSKKGLDGPNEKLSDEQLDAKKEVLDRIFYGITPLIKSEDNRKFLGFGNISAEDIKSHALDEMFAEISRAKDDSIALDDEMYARKAPQTFSELKENPQNREPKAANIKRSPISRAVESVKQQREELLEQRKAKASETLSKPEERATNTNKDKEPRAINRSNKSEDRGSSTSRTPRKPITPSRGNSEARKPTTINRSNKSEEMEAPTSRIAHKPGSPSQGNAEAEKPKQENISQQRDSSSSRGPTMRPKPVKRSKAPIASEVRNNSNDSIGSSVSLDGDVSKVNQLDPPKSHAQDRPSPNQKPALGSHSEKVLKDKAAAQNNHKGQGTQI